MRNLFILLLIFIHITCINAPAFGVSAYPLPIEIVQPDGTKITVILKGDESAKWAQTTDGYSIMKNERGIYEYAMLNTSQDMVPSGFSVKNERERTITELQFLSTVKKGINYSESQLSLMKTITLVKKKSTLKSAQILGTRKFLCILIGFTDKSFVKTKADFENLLNQAGNTAEGATGSVNDFYKENSYGQLNMSFTVAGPYTAAHEMAYYGGNNSNGKDKNPGALVSEAILLADPNVNYADFDNDNDGAVDGVYVIHAGYGEDSGADANTIWAHSSSVPAVSLDGKIVSDYACSSELRGASGTGITRIGVICHEMGHVLGTMDFYDTNNSTDGSYAGTGNWDLMANGSWNNNGTTPAHHNPYSKVVVFGWATFKSLASGATIILNDAETNNNSFYRINTTTNNEYFLIENRQKQKFDSYIPGHGMVIYHVDGNYINNSGNSINTGSHQGMYPVCANASGVPPVTYGTINSAGLPFPGTGNKTSFTDTTIPNSLSWSSTLTSSPITNISEDLTNKTISFSAPVLPDRPLAPVANPASNIFQNSLAANWALSFNATNYRLDVSTNSSFSTFVQGYNDKDAGNVKTLNVTGLSPRTVYYYRVRAFNTGGISENSNIITARTLSTPPAAPTGLTVVSCNDLVTLKWRKNKDPYFKLYRIFGGSAINPTTKIDSSSATSTDTTKIISGLVHGQTYFFRITAVNDDGPESTYSSLASTIVKSGVVPKITEKWNDVLISYNLGDSIENYQWYKNSAPIPGASAQFYQTNKQPGVYFVASTDLEGCVNNSNTIVVSGLKSLSIFPNPVTQSFTLNLADPSAEDVLISIINSAGIKVGEFRASGPGGELLREIPVNNLEPGIYIVQVLINQKELHSTKIVVVK